MQVLNFPQYSFRLDSSIGKEMIFDPVRKRWVRLTPEEWVRQNVIAYLIDEKQVPISLIGVEKRLAMNGLIKRFDIVIFNRSGSPVLLVECKAPSVVVNEKVFDQAGRYNMQLNVKYFLITNGIDHFCCQIDYVNKSYVFIKEIPLFVEMV